MKQILALTSLAAVLLTGATAVSAQGLRPEQPITVTVTSPKSGAIVGRMVTFTGKARPNVGLGLTVDENSYIVPSDRGTTEGREFQNAGVADANGNFSFTVNLNGQAVREAEGGTYQTISAGQHSFQVHEMYAPDAGSSNVITLNVTDGEAAAETKTAPTPSVTPTPTPSPTASPLTADTASEIDWPKLILAGALGALAAYGIHRWYYRKRKR